MRADKMKFTTNFLIRAIKHQIKATLKLIADGIKFYIDQLIALEGRLELLEAYSSPSLAALGKIAKNMIKSVKGNIHFTSTEIKAIKSILESGLLCEGHTQFKVGRKDYYFLGIEGKEIKVRIGENQTRDYSNEIDYVYSNGVVTLK